MGKLHRFCELEVKDSELELGLEHTVKIEAINAAYDLRAANNELE